MIDRLDRAASAGCATESVVQRAPRSAPAKKWDSLRATPDAAERLSRFSHSLDAREFPQPDSVVRRLRSSDGPCAASISTFHPSSFAICGGSFYVP